MATSDGGSSSYYEIDLPPGVGKLNPDGSIRVEVKDIIRYALDNDFDKGNIFKALVRAGKKEGTDVSYDLHKNVFFAVDMLANHIGTTATEELLNKLNKTLLRR